jgi:hypothetical protein
MVHIARAEPVMIPGEADWGLKVSAQDLERHTDKLVRGLILCSPCNPTGAVYTRSELKAIAAWAKKHEVWIVADEIYGRIFYGGRRRAVLPRASPRGHRAAGGDHRSEQGVRDDRLADRSRRGPDPSRQGDGQPAVAHHQRREPPGPVGRDHGVQRPRRGAGCPEDGDGVRAAARSRGGAVP